MLAKLAKLAYNSYLIWAPSQKACTFLFIRQAYTMARITVEECLDHVDNRFELVMVASKRARQIATQGKDPMVDVADDKPPVIALREIEKGLIDPNNIGIEEQVDDLTEELAAEFGL